MDQAKHTTTICGLFAMRSIFFVFLMFPDDWDDRRQIRGNATALENRIFPKMEA